MEHYLNSKKKVNKLVLLLTMYGRYKHKSELKVDYTGTSLTDQQVEERFKQEKKIMDDTVKSTFSFFHKIDTKRKELLGKK